MCAVNTVFVISIINMKQNYHLSDSVNKKLKITFLKVEFIAELLYWTVQVQVCTGVHSKVASECIEEVQFCIAAAHYNYMDLKHWNSWHIWGQSEHVTLTQVIILSTVMRAIIRTLSITFNLQWAKMLKQLSITTEGWFKISVDLQVDKSVFGQITLTLLQCHCGRPQTIKARWKCRLGWRVNTTVPQKCDQDYSTGSIQKSHFITL